MKTPFALLTIISFLILAGCGQTQAPSAAPLKKEKIEGQVFIRTKGASSVKLGSVTVMLLDRQIATKYYEASVSKSMATNRNIVKQYDEIHKTTLRLEKQLKDAENAQAESELQYSKLSAQVSDLGYTLRATPANSQKYRTMSASYSQAVSDLQAVPLSVEKSKKEVQRITDAYIESVKAERDVLSAAENTYEVIYSAEWPGLVQTTTTDADGNYSFEVINRTNFVLAASANRLLSKDDESYYWFVPVPAVGPVHLNNSNMQLIGGD